MRRPRPTDMAARRPKNALAKGRRPKDRSRRNSWATEIGWWRCLDILVEAPLFLALLLTPVVAGECVAGQPPRGGELSLSLAFCTLILVALALAALRELFELDPLPWPPVALVVAAGVLVAAHVASYAVTIDRHATTIETARILCGMLMVVLLARESGRSPDVRLRAAIAIAAGTAWSAGVGIRDYLFNVRMGDPSWRTFGTFASPNSLAGQIVIGFPLALALVSVRRLRPWQAVTIVGCMIIAVCLPLTASKAGLLAFVASMAVFAVLRIHGPAHRRVLLALLCCAALGLVVFVLPPVRNRLVVALTTQNHSWVFRYYTWLAAAACYIHHPVVGTGAGTFSQAYLPYALAGPTHHAHCQLLETASDTGSIGLLATVALLVLGIRFTLAPAHADSDPSPDAFLSLLRPGAAAALVAACIHNLFDYDWYVLPSMLSVAAVIGISCGVGRSRRPAVRMALRRSIAAIALVVAVGLIGLVQRERAAARLFESAQASRRSGNTSAAVLQLEAATRLAPGWGAAWRLLGILQRYEPDAGREAFGRAIAVQPAFAGNRMAFAEALIEAGQYDEAKEQCEAAVRLDPHATQALVELAAMAQQEGGLATAIGWLERLAALETTPYGRYKAAPEILNTEFLYAHAGLAELFALRDGPDSPSAKRERARALALAEDMTRRYEAQYAALMKKHDDSPDRAMLVRSFLAAYHFTPEAMRQVDIVRAALLLAGGSAGGEADTARDRAMSIHSETVRQIESGNWPGVLVATRAERLVSGL